MGGSNGCNNINELFMENCIKTLFGEECFNEAKSYICKNKYYEWKNLEKKIE